MKQKVKITSILTILSFCTVLSTVFIVNKTIQNGIIFGKYFWFYLAFTFSSIAILISYFKNRQPFNVSIVDIFITIFCIIGFIVSYTLFEQASTKIISLLLCLILYYNFRIFLSQKVVNYWLICFFIFSGAIEALWGGLQLIGIAEHYNSRNLPTGSFQNPGPYGGYLAMVFPMALYYILRDFHVLKCTTNKLLRPFYLRFYLSFFTLISIAFMLHLANSRASWLAALISGITIVFAVIVKLKKINIKSFVNIHKIKLILGVSFLLIVLSLTVHHLYGIRKGSSDTRVLIWKISLPIIPQQPSGVGIGHYLGAYTKAHIKYMNSPNATTQDKKLAICTRFSYNEYITICIEFGILGLLFYLLSIIGAVFIGFKNKRFAPTASIISLSVFASMSYPFSILPFIISISFLLALCVTNYSDNSINSKEKSLAGYLIILSYLIAIPCLYNRFNFYKAYHRWEYLKKNTLKFNSNLLEEYAKLEPFLSDHDLFLNDYAFRLSSENKYSSSINIIQKSQNISMNYDTWIGLADNYKKMKDYKSAEKHIMAGASLMPLLSNYYYPLMDLYLESNNLEKAEKLLNSVKERLPKSDIIYLFEKKIELKRACINNRPL